MLFRDLQGEHRRAGVMGPAASCLLAASCTTFVSAAFELILLVALVTGVATLIVVILSSGVFAAGGSAVSLMVSMKLRALNI